MTEFIAFAGAVSHAINIGKLIVETRDETKLTALKLDFTSALLELHSKQLSVAQDYQAILDANESLKKQLVAYERWEQESQRYQLHELAPGIFVYKLKPEFAAGQPQHSLCVTCYQDRKTSILHRDGKDSNIWICTRDINHQLNNEEYGTAYSG